MLIGSDALCAGSDKIAVRRQGRTLFEVDVATFHLAFRYTAGCVNNVYLSAIENRLISMADLTKLCEKSEIPYPILLMPYEDVKLQVEKYCRTIFSGVGKDSVSIASRGHIELGVISPLLKDITRKQQSLKKIKDCSTPSRIVSFLVRNRGANNCPEGQAGMLRRMIGYDINKISTLNKQATFEYFSELLARQNVCVSLYAHGLTPRLMCCDDFRGIVIKDKKFPFLFIKSSGAHSVDLWGVHIFTLAVLTLCLALNKSGAVLIGDENAVVDDVGSYLVSLAEEFLMPKESFASFNGLDIVGVKKLAGQYSVTPSAMCMRLWHIGAIDKVAKDNIMDNLEESFSKYKRSRHNYANRITEHDVVKYNGPLLTRSVIDAYHNGSLDKGAAERILSFKKGVRLSLDGIGILIGEGG